MARAATCSALAAVALLASCGNSGTEVDAVSGHHFDPPSLEVQVGATVSFRNSDGEPHSVTAYEDSLPEGAEYFSSGNLSGEKEAREHVARGLLEQGEEFRVTFDQPGTYRYFCIPHEDDGMKGEIVVRR